ncbi:hypothetical protein JVU11DRAFT_3835 [Chiua virens]|nr:hypothetical protein JVU11DRAFT_3835 [Chiua virens]
MVPTPAAEAMGDEKFLRQSNKLRRNHFLDDEAFFVYASVFEYDFVHPLNKSTIPLAKKALRKLRTNGTIRHPDVLKFMDVVESETTIFIITERVRPL